MNTEDKRPRLTARQWTVLGLLSSVAFLVVVDTATVITALPSMRTDLGFSPAGLQWVVTGYTLALGGLTMLGGRLADRFGRRRVFLAGLGLFTVTSWLCGIAWTAEVLVAARIAQGAGAALVMPAALSILMVAFAEGPVRNKALGMWASVGGLGGIAGFVLGGPLIDGPGWGWIFFINIPVGVIVFAAVLRLLDRDGAPSGGRGFDVGGAVAATGGLAALVYGISSVPETGWGHPAVLISLAAFAVAAVAFVLVERRAATPLVPLRLFANPVLSGGNLVLLLMGMAINGTWFVVTLYVQGLLGYSATGFGLLMLAPAAASVIGAQLGQRLVNRFSLGSMAAVGAGAIGAAVTLLLRAAPGSGLLSTVLVPVLVIGLAFGVGIVAASIAALAGVPASDAGAASGVKESTFMIGSPIGVALLSSVAVWGEAAALDGGAAGPDAAVQGFRLAFAVAALLAVAAVVIALTAMRRGAVANEEAQVATAAVA